MATPTVGTGVTDALKAKLQTYLEDVATTAAMQNAAFREKDIKDVARIAAKDVITPLAIAASGIGAVAFLLGAGSLYLSFRRTRGR